MLLYAIMNFDMIMLQRLGVDTPYENDEPCCFQVRVIDNNDDEHIIDGNFDLDFETAFRLFCRTIQNDNIDINSMIYITKTPVLTEDEWNNLYRNEIEYPVKDYVYGKSKFLYISQ
jgi:hypothetical protein